MHAVDRSKEPFDPGRFAIPEKLRWAAVLARKAKCLFDVARYDIRLIGELPTIFLDQF